VVDDDREQVSSLVELLRRAGYEPHAAYDGASALRAYRAVSPSLVLLDLGLPDVDGFHLTRRFKKEQSGFVPVVLLTGHGDPDSKRRGLEAGADELLQKPVSPFELELRLRSLLRIKTLTMRLEEQNQRLLELAHTDALCGVPNRRAVVDDLRREARRAARYATPLAVAVIDLDHFKQVNDRYGHSTGDAVLSAAARALRSGIREEDTLGRLGGEEFLVVAPQIGAQEAVRLAERLRSLVARAVVPGPQGPILITASVGVAAMIGGGTRAGSELLEAADRALYAAKKAGRNRVASAGLPSRLRV
jgi:diguanylate cyclase (GGDEF)-like protein